MLGFDLSRNAPMNATLKIRKQTPRSAPKTGEQIVDHWRIARRVIVGTHCPAQQGLPEMRALKGPMTRLNSDQGTAETYIIPGAIRVFSQRRTSREVTVNTNT
jgi:hypothetical protein